MEGTDIPIMQLSSSVESLAEEEEDAVSSDCRDVLAVPEVQPYSNDAPSIIDMAKEITFFIVLRSYNIFVGSPTASSRVAIQLVA